MDMSNEDIRKLLEQFSSNSFRSNRGGGSEGSNNSSSAGSAPQTTDQSVQEKCVKLFLQDYPSSILIPNLNGELSTSYPSSLIVPKLDRNPNNGRVHNQELEEGEECVEGAGVRKTNTNNDSLDTGFNHLDTANLRDLMLKARVARCRARFPVPVILIDGKYVCRSATLSGGPEIYGRSGFDLFFATGNDQDTSSNVSNGANHVNTSNGSTGNGVKFSNGRTPASCDVSMPTATIPANNTSQQQPQQQPSMQTLNQTITSLPSTISTTLSLGDSTSQVFSKVRSQDINLLKVLGVKYICDLMVEKKKVKFGLNITSSEKADKESRYKNDFDILSLPYPGCEFFKAYRDSNYSAEGLIFDWNQNFVDAILDVPINILEKLNLNSGTDNCGHGAESHGQDAAIVWNEYKSWDILTLTSNYLKLLINLLSDPEDKGSILIHCISGWDRTPLFISLLRLSLWADGAIHQSLNAIEITYLTLAYDWYLFGHNLSDRLLKGEEILFFCFYFLKFMTGDEFNYHKIKTMDCKVDVKEEDTVDTSVGCPKQEDFDDDEDGVEVITDSSAEKDLNHENVTSLLTDSVIEVPLNVSMMAPPFPAVTSATCYLGSCTSLNSTSSIGSVNCGLKEGVEVPPSNFPASISSSQSSGNSFYCINNQFETSSIKSPAIRDPYPSTPPTLTNSGTDLLDDDDGDVVDGPCEVSPVVPRRIVSRNASASSGLFTLDTVDEVSSCINHGANDDVSIVSSMDSSTGTLTFASPSTPPTATGSDGVDTCNGSKTSSLSSSVTKSQSSAIPIIGNGVQRTMKEASESGSGSRRVRKVSIDSEAWQMVSETGSIKDNVSLSKYFITSPSDSPNDTKSIGSGSQRSDSTSSGTTATTTSSLTRKTSVTTANGSIKSNGHSSTSTASVVNDASMISQTLIHVPSSSSSVMPQTSCSSLSPSKSVAVEKSWTSSTSHESSSSSSTGCTPNGTSRKGGCPCPGSRRKEKLQAVRSLFYNSYSTVIGFRFNRQNRASGSEVHVGIGSNSSNGNSNGNNNSNNNNSHGFGSILMSHLSGYTSSASSSSSSSGRVPAPN